MIDREKLSMNLSNFYSEHGYEGINIDFFIDKYIETGKAVEEYLRQIKSNQTLKSMEVFRKYNFAAFKAHQACYNIDKLLIDSDNASFMGLSGNLTDRKKQWEELNNEDKANFLDSKNLYIELSAKRSFDDVNPEIISLDLQDLNKRVLKKDKDYFLFNNKIYLIGQAAVATSRNSDLIATNIFVDYDTPNRLLGSRIGIGYNSNISKSEYKDFIVMVAYALIKGPSIKNLKDAFSVLIGWEGSDIFDKYKATGVRKDMWDNPSTAILTPFDFLVTVPASLVSTVGLDEKDRLVSSADRLDIFRYFLNVVKPVDTNYILALSENIEEIINSNDHLSENLNFQTNDELENDDTGMNKISTEFDSYLEHSSVLRKINYDSENNYDENFSYDIDTVSLGDKYYGDLVKIKYIEFPQFPVDFNVSLSSMTGRATISFKDNAESVQGYVVKRNEEIIKDLPANGDGSEITFIDYEIKDKPRGVYEYYAQSYYYLNEESNYSRTSAKITISK